MTTESRVAAAPTANTAPASSDDAAIRATIDDYYFGWYDADGDRMARALHPDLAKRGWLRDTSGRWFVDPDTDATMVEAAAAGRGRRSDPTPRLHRRGQRCLRRQSRAGRGPRRALRGLSPPRPDAGRVADPERAVVPELSIAEHRPAASASRSEQSRARYPDRTGFVARDDGLRSFYEVYGAGDPAILFVPTWSVAHSRIWKAQIPWFASRHRVVTFDALGNGRSDRPPQPEAYDEAALAGDIVAVMDATATERAVFVSLSLGAQRSVITAAATGPGRRARDPRPGGRARHAPPAANGVPVRRPPGHG
jgi:hypothetical protein